MESPRNSDSHRGFATFSIFFLSYVIGLSFPIHKSGQIHCDSRASRRFYCDRYSIFHKLTRSCSIWISLFLSVKPISLFTFLLYRTSHPFLTASFSIRKTSYSLIQEAASISIAILPHMEIAMLANWMVVFARLNGNTSIAAYETPFDTPVDRLSVWRPVNPCRDPRFLILIV